MSPMCVVDVFLSRVSFRHLGSGWFVRVWPHQWMDPLIVFYFNEVSRWYKLYEMGPSRKQVTMGILLKEILSLPPPLPVLAAIGEQLCPTILSLQWYSPLSHATTMDQKPLNLWVKVNLSSLKFIPPDILSQGDLHQRCLRGNTDYRLRLALSLQEINGDSSKVFPNVIVSSVWILHPHIQTATETYCI